ncbi:MAG: ABC transporter permease, partial [Balneolaceae bacterium]|nr:ABC transporter permease [Balneolaceae bacterium]
MAFRNFQKQKSSFLINVAGLSIGMACSILILLWVNDELAYDRFHRDIGRIYRVMENQQYAQGNIFTTSSTPGPLAPALIEEIPEIEHAATYTWNVDLLFRHGEQSLKEEGIYARNDLFRILSVDLLSGHSDELLVQPHSVVLSRTLARKYFGKENPVGESVSIGGQVRTITGVFADLPENSSIRFDFVLRFEDFQEENPWATTWGNNGPRTLVKLNEGVEEETVESKIEDFIKRKNESSVVELFLYPYADAYLYGRFDNGRPAGGRIEY